LNKNTLTREMQKMACGDSRVKLELSFSLSCLVMLGYPLPQPIYGGECANSRPYSKDMHGFLDPYDHSVS
jgi:hypothetical protein